MHKDCLVVLFGDSLLMDTVEASLSDSPHFGIIRFHQTVTNVAARLKTLQPNLIVFDLGSPLSQFIIPFLQEQPSVPLLGLDVTSSRVIALSCEHYPVLTVDDLSKVILSKIVKDHESPDHIHALLSLRSRDVSVLDHAKALNESEVGSQALDA
jgi:hypothetical protein